MLGSFEPEFLIPVVLFFIPVVAIVGGIITGIVRLLGQQRLAELQQRERIAAIERGLDPAKLPPPPAWDAPGIYDPAHVRDMRQSRGYLIGGIVTLFTGAGLTAFLTILNPGENTWAVGIIPSSIGMALLISAWLVRPRGNGAPPPPRA